MTSLIALEDIPPPIADEELQAHKEAQHEIAVFVLTGVKMKGRIIKFDQDSIVLTSSFPEGVLISRSNVVTIMRETDRAHQHQHQSSKESRSHTGSTHGC